MAERKNTGIAVPDAKRLNDCYHELSEAIAARPAVKGDGDLWQYDYAALPGGPEGEDRENWNHRCGSNDVALVALRGAVRDHQLRLWTYGPHGAGEVDRHDLKELTFRTFKSGTYQPHNRLLDAAGLADSPLWVKEADWHRYMAELWAVRYPAERPAGPVDNGSKGGRPPEIDWDAMKRLAEDALREHPDIRRSKLADSLVAEYAAKISTTAPVKRTVERKLAKWNMGATKPVRT